MKYLSITFLILALTACTHDEWSDTGTRTVPIRLSVMTNEGKSQRTPGDPGLKDEFALPSHAYIYVLTNNMPNEDPAGNTTLASFGDVTGNGHLLLDPDKWVPDADHPEIYRYSGDININMPLDAKSGRVMAAVASREIPGLVLPEAPTIESISRMTYSVPDAAAEVQNDFMKNLYSTPYNLVYRYDATTKRLVGAPLAPTEENRVDRLYYGTIHDAGEKISYVDVILYHVAARLDVKWEVAEELRDNNAVTFFEVQNLPQSPCYLFRPTENVDDRVNPERTSYTTVQNRTLVNTSKADGNLDPSTYWQGRRVIYVPQHYRRKADGQNYYPFDVRLGRNGDKIDTPAAGKTQTFEQPFTALDPVFTSWNAVNVRINTAITY